MSNRIKELRKNKNLTLIDLSKKINIPNNTISQYENERRNPTESTWQKIADFFNVSVEYLKGAYSKEEIAKIIQDEYKRQYDYEKSSKITLKYVAEIKLLSSTVDDYFISIGIIPYDIKKESFLLSEQQINDLAFWCSNLRYVYKKISIKWLLNKPTLNANKDDVLSAVNDAMDGIINESSLSLSNPWLYRNDNLIIANQYFAQRLKFIDKHTFYKEETYDIDGYKHTEIIPYINWNETNKPKDN